MNECVSYFIPDIFDPTGLRQVSLQRHFKDGQRHERGEAPDPRALCRTNYPGLQVQRGLAEVS